MIFFGEMLMKIDKLSWQKKKKKPTPSESWFAVLPKEQTKPLTNLKHPVKGHNLRASGGINSNLDRKYHFDGHTEKTALDHIRADEVFLVYINREKKKSCTKSILFTMYN